MLNNKNQHLIDFEKKIYTIGNSTVTIQNRNKIHVDEDGRLFVMKDGIKDYGHNKQKYGLMPNFCPQCQTLMGKNRHDRFFWGIHNRCFKCSMKLQAQMKRDGIFQQFAVKFMKDKLTSTCDKAIQFYEYTKQQHNKDVLINEHGDTQKWSYDDIQKFNQMTDLIIEDIIKYKSQAIQYFDKQLKENKK